jgi:hypothetical protein
MYILTSSWQVAPSDVNFPAGHDEHEDAAVVENSPGLHCYSLGMSAHVTGELGLHVRDSEDGYYGL